MINAQSPHQDRRKHQRKNITIDVQLKVGINLKGSGCTHDISIDGLLISSPEIFCYFKPELAHAFEDAEVILSFPKEGLTVQGKVIRIDASSKQLAIRITHRSDERTWKTMCE